MDLPAKHLDLVETIETAATVLVPQKAKTKSYHICYGRLPKFPSEHHWALQGGVHKKLFLYDPAEQDV